MANWLQEFYKLHAEAIERHTGLAQNLVAVEEALESDRAAGVIKAETLKTIEECPAWTYPWWWPPGLERIDLHGTMDSSIGQYAPRPSFPLSICSTEVYRCCSLR